MNLPLLIISAALSLTLAGTAWSGEMVEELRAINKNATVHIQCTRGDLRVEGWDRSEVLVTGELDDLAQELEFEVDDDRVMIRVRMPADNVNRGDGSDLIIRLPFGTQLRVDAVSADVTLDGITGAAAVRTVSGDVRAIGLGSLFHVNTTSGDIELSEGTGKLRITTTSGDVEVRMAASEVQLDSVSGEIELELEAFDSVVTNTVSAELDLEGRLNPFGRIESRSVSGDLQFRLEKPVNAALDIRAGPGGEIDNELSEDVPRRRDDRSLVLDAALGTGGGLIRAVTVSGEISLDDR